MRPKPDLHSQDPRRRLTALLHHHPGHDGRGWRTAWLAVTAAASLLAAALAFLAPTAAQAQVGMNDSPLSVTVTASPNPTYTATPIRLSVSPSGGVRPYTVTCNFGDGAIGLGPRFGHSYGTPGLYIVRCKVTDAAGHTAYGLVFVKIKPWPATTAKPTTTKPTTAP
jgi:hypothetical protein